MAEHNADPEAWFADQLAQLQLNWPFDTVTEVSWDPGPDYGRRTTVLVPGTQSFETVQKLAQEYGEMCAARALADYADLTIVTKDEDVLRVLVGGVEVKPLGDVFPNGGTGLREMGAGPLAVVHGLDDDEVVR